MWVYSFNCSGKSTLRSLNDYLNILFKQVCLDKQLHNTPQGINDVCQSLLEMVMGWVYIDDMQAMNTSHFLVLINMVDGLTL